jgi:hypothetical protein
VEGEEAVGLGASSAYLGAEAGRRDDIGVCFGEAVGRLNSDGMRSQFIAAVETSPAFLGRSTDLFTSTNPESRA